jgi:integrase
MAPLLSEVIRAFEQWADGALKPGTCRVYRMHLDGFLKSCGDMPVDQLRRNHLLAWAKKWHQLQAVQRLMNWARDDGELIDRSPFRKIKLPASGERHRTLSRRVMLQIMHAAGPAFRRYLVGLRETIARPQEVRVLRWEWLQWAGGPANFVNALLSGNAFFVLTRYKSRERVSNPHKPRIILVSPRLGKMLLRLSMGRGDNTGPVFLNVYGEPWTSNALRLQMRRIRRRLDLGPDEDGEQICCYTWRHTGATAASAAGVKDRILADMMGHTSTRTTARYQHLDVHHLQAAMEKARKDGIGPL